MPVQVTVSDVADTTRSEVSRRLLIDGWLVAGDKAFPAFDPAGLNEFSERKTCTVAMPGGSR
ncbi:hypothetical protein [Mycobacterium sp. pR1184]|uniref:hypothetical protein n=1 Tax=Mycobacterium sp. pR1184 TaxID=3238981 RepID=UPI00351B8285